MSSSHRLLLLLLLLLLSYYYYYYYYYCVMVRIPPSLVLLFTDSNELYKLVVIVVNFLARMLLDRLGGFLGLCGAVLPIPWNWKLSSSI